MFECSRGSTYFWHGSPVNSAELTSYECPSLRYGRRISFCTTSKQLYTCSHSHLLNTGKYQGMAKLVMFTCTCRAAVTSTIYEQKNRKIAIAFVFHGPSRCYSLGLLALFHCRTRSAYLYYSVWSGIRRVANSTAAVMREQQLGIDHRSQLATME